MSELELCPDCKALLPPSNGAGHRYVGASPACWELFAALSNAGEPPLAHHPLNELLVDAYMVQHPGEPSPQAIQSVAVHLLTLYGVLERGVEPDNALWIRMQAVSQKHGSKNGRFAWLAPPDFSDSITIADIVERPTPVTRTELLEQYIRSIWQLWRDEHVDIVAQWYEQYIGD